MQTINHWIDGSYTATNADGRLGDVMNPATGKVSSRVALASTAVEIPAREMTVAKVFLAGTPSSTGQPAPITTAATQTTAVSTGMDR